MTSQAIGLYHDRHKSRQMSELMRLRASDLRELAVRRPSYNYLPEEMPMNCQNCHKPLSAVQWSSDEHWKTCPRCSAANGREHVFYPYPEKFGTTPARATHEHPEGPQSYCTRCRADRSPDFVDSCQCHDVSTA